ncbi:hypothetical protein ABIA39_005494 [Nocardia sp. GAS34]
MTDSGEWTTRTAGLPLGMDSSSVAAGRGRGPRPATATGCDVGADGTAGAAACRPDETADARGPEVAGGPGPLR